MTRRNTHTEHAIHSIPKTEWISLTVVSISCWLLSVLIPWMYILGDEALVKESELSLPPISNAVVGDGNECIEIDVLDKNPSKRDIIPYDHINDDIVEINDFPDWAVLFGEGLESLESDDIVVNICGCVDPFDKLLHPAFEGDNPLKNSDDDPKLVDFIVVEQEPIPVNMDDIRRHIKYPQAARDAGITGQVVVRLLVDKKGRYKKHKLINQVHPLLSEEVEKHLPKLVFTPAIHNGKPIKFWVNIPFRFEQFN